MSVPVTLSTDGILEVVLSRIVVRDGLAAARPRSQLKPSLPSRIAVVGNSENLWNRCFGFSGLPSGVAADNAVDHLFFRVHLPYCLVRRDRARWH